MLHIKVGLLRKRHDRIAHVALEASTVVAISDVNQFQRIDFFPTPLTGVGPLCLRPMRGRLWKIIRPVTKGSEYVIPA